MIRTLTTLLILLLVTGCPGPAPLPPFAPPAPPPIVKVPVLVPLPAEMKRPCAEPQPRALPTDAALLNAGEAWMVTAKCANQKLRDIDKAEQQAIEAPQP